MKFRKTEVSEVFIIDDKDVVARFFELIEVEADGFVEPSANTVPADGGLFYFFADDDSEAGLAVVVVTKN